MRDIGGYMEMEHYQGSEFHEGLALNSGRNCFRYLIKAKKIKKIRIPDWCCPVINDVCKEEDLQICTYHVQSLSQPYKEELPSDGTYIYIINYYGQIDDFYMKELTIKYKNIILDNAQDFFRKPMKGTDTIYTCRKYFGVPDGAYLYSESVLEEPIKKDRSYERMMHLLGRFECGAGTYFDVFQENENRLGKSPLMYMSELTHNILRSIDYEYVKERRSDNFKMLQCGLEGKNLLNVRTAKGGYMYPYKTRYADMLRNKLIENNIYIPILWRGAENEYSDSILPLPCDQRYTKQDMEYIIDLIKTSEEKC